VFTSQMGKAGPLYNTTSCENCHINNGPGAPLTGVADEKSSMVFKLYGAGALGNQLHLQDGSATLAGTDSSKSVTLGDGTVVPLTKPKFTLTPKSGDASHFSGRVARKLIGLGLLEAIDERTILERADRLDCNADGISGRPSYVKDPISGALRIGRMGWKAEKISVQHQVAEAAFDDIGVTSSIFTGGATTPELSDVELGKLTTYMRLVGVPAQRDNGKPDVLQGEQIFKTVGCSNCHVTDVVTGPNHPFSELRNQSIKPFTDLLLHDMGPDLADDSGVAASDAPDAPPSASEWRTPPLWGVGLYKIVNGHTGLLHDGRAASVLEAVLWHGGEADNVKTRFSALSTADRNALLAYVQSL
ncbi:MAG TPA: di-heme oxidoredictase family protein, partial [Polyangiaceae bacterium]|nr:di-heme oxidoredictase family protein [Polyangiaceae bacterium]